MRLGKAEKPGVVIIGNRLGRDAPLRGTASGTLAQARCERYRAGNHFIGRSCGFGAQRRLFRCGCCKGRVHLRFLNSFII